MMKARFSTLIGAALVFGLVLTSISQAVLTELTNGTFNSDLAGWTSSAEGVSWEQSSGNGYAIFREYADGETSSLWQEFVLPDGAQELSFEINLTSIGGVLPTTDVFTASLLMGGTPMEVYSIDNSEAYNHPEWTSGDVVVTWDVLPLAGQNVRLEFGLLNDDDGYATTVELDNVKVSVIPVPGAIVLGCIGAGLIGLFRRSKAIR